MKVWPLKFREFSAGRFIFANDAGDYFQSDESFLTRYASGVLSPGDNEYLLSNGHAYEQDGDLNRTAYTCRWSRRQATRSEIAYVILVPTLRCNLSCTYCQVSRAAERAPGYDWTPEILQAVLDYLDGLSTSTIKVEFQGGEPLLRLDLLQTIRDFCRNRFTSAEFIVCTNLQSVSERAWAFFEADDTYVSTSLDGDRLTHKHQRTETEASTDAFAKNLRRAASSLPRRLSALPTIDVERPPTFDNLVTSYEEIGVSSIYLRPINHQGFARRREMIDAATWNRFHAEFVDYLIDRNFRTGRVVEEYYLSHCLKRVLRAGEDGHVDLRNPNLFASSYLVIDHDGRFFPTDEARMLYRVGLADLSLGTVQGDPDFDALTALNQNSLNNFDPDCIHCPYQAFCGSDVLDDLSRYGRIDIPRADTWFCQRHTALFDLVFSLMYRTDEATRYSLAHWAGLNSFPKELAPEHS